MQQNLKRPPKKRIDQLLVESRLAPSREKAQALILAGLVLVDDEPVEKAGTLIAESSVIRLRGSSSPYVGRGGEKLAFALKHFAIAVQGVIALDLGSSTGGFTDCLLQHGATKVYAVDVGVNQLAYSLRKDPRVIVLEKTHAKDLSLAHFKEPVSFATVDLSFTSLRRVLPHLLSLLKDPATLLCLVKPQFELGPEFVAEGGVVPAEEDQLLAVRLVVEEAEKLGCRSLGSVPSELRGAKKGNQEYFIQLLYGEE